MIYLFEKKEKNVDFNQTELDILVFNCASFFFYSKRLFCFILLEQSPEVLIL